MDEDFTRNARKGKAKVEEEEDPNVLLPKAVPRTYINMGVDIIYLKLVGPQRDPDLVATDSPEGVKKILFRFRNKELSRICGKEDERLINFQNASKATIGILSNAPARIHRHLYLELIGIAMEVKIAELLIGDVITEGYDRPYIPRAFMPINICHQAIPSHFMKIVPLLGINGDNLLKMESLSGTWIEVDTPLINEGNSIVRVVNVYGQELDVTNVISMMKNRLHEYDEEVGKQEHEVDLILEEIASDEGLDKLIKHADEKECHNRKKTLKFQIGFEDYVDKTGSGLDIEALCLWVNGHDVTDILKVFREKWKSVANVVKGFRRAITFNKTI